MRDGDYKHAMSSLTMALLKAQFGTEEAAIEFQKVYVFKLMNRFVTSIEKNSSAALCSKLTEFVVHLLESRDGGVDIIAQPIREHMLHLQTVLKHKTQKQAEVQRAYSFAKDAASTQTAFP